MTWRHRRKGAVWPVGSVICVSDYQLLLCEMMGRTATAINVAEDFLFKSRLGFVLSKDLLHASHLSSLCASFSMPASGVTLFL